MANRMTRLNWLVKDTNCPYSQINTRYGKSSRSKDYFMLKTEYYEDDYYKNIRELKITPVQSIVYFEVGDYSWVNDNAIFE